MTFRKPRSVRNAHAFVFSLVALLFSLVVTFFIKEIPLRQTSGIEDRAKAMAAATAEAEPASAAGF